ncbi:unnamed protein product [Ceratitis capitata]|uniref:(Mediterranean fruit fly) hypothetical protein n=1 Tax=Ceratitis capitata TaxID=7213 RepID=A0A811V8C0_CERCA|nr:unnamed protein product [Ceratitis capitata]
MQPQHKLSCLLQLIWVNSVAIVGGSNNDNNNNTPSKRGNKLTMENQISQQQEYRLKTVFVPCMYYDIILRTQIPIKAGEQQPQASEIKSIFVWIKQQQCDLKG